MPCFLASFVVLLASGPLHEQANIEQKTYSAGEIGGRIVAFVERAEAAGFTGAVLAARGGEVIAAVGVGGADLEGREPITPSTLFEIASATKPFTGAAVMRLVQDERLHLDDPIALHLPGVPEECAAITVRHLLQHTSGIPGSNSMGAGDDLGAVLPFFLRGGPKHPPGTHWEYWNQGYALLSEIIARAGGEPYTAYCKRVLFDPAGMSLTRFTGDDPPGGALVAVGRSAHGRPRSALDHPYGEYGFQYRGMGGVVTTVWDLWRWDRALRGEGVLDAAAKAELFAPGLNEYALGWFVRGGERGEGGRVAQSHSGGVRGFVCEVRRYPDDDACLFVLCNRDDAPLRQVTQALEQLLFDEPLTCKDLPRSLDAGMARAIAGTYRGPDGALLILEAEGKVTRARVEWSPPGGPVTRAVLGLGAQGEPVLYEWTAEIKVDVERADDGSVSRVSIMDRGFERVP